MNALVVFGHKAIVKMDLQTKIIALGKLRSLMFLQDLTMHFLDDLNLQSIERMGFLFQNDSTKQIKGLLSRALLHKRFEFFELFFCDNVFDMLGHIVVETTCIFLFDTLRSMGKSTDQTTEISSMSFVYNILSLYTGFFSIAFVETFDIFLLFE